MIRLIIFALGIFIIWVLFISNFEKRNKIIITVMALVFSIGIFWFDGYDKKPKANRVLAEEVISCGISAKHSYRSNFDLQICLQNTSAQGHVKRIEFEVIAQRCDKSNNCQLLESVRRNLQVDLSPNEKTTLNENLSFDSVDPNANNIAWEITILTVRAL